MHQWVFIRIKVREFCVGLESPMKFAFWRLTFRPSAGTIIAC
jgi:hypothetical protein